MQPFADPHKTKLKIAAEIPIEQQVKYIPGVLQTLKFAWIQYLSLLIPVLFAFNLAAEFIFRHKLIDSMITSDLMPRKRV